MLTPQLVAQLVGNRLGDTDGSNSAKYIFLIPEALKATARKIAANPYLRSLLMSDRTSTTLGVNGNGYFDLDGLDTFHVLQEYIDVGEIYADGNNYPLQKLTSAQQSQLPTDFTDFLYYYIAGNRLYETSGTATDLHFIVPKFPATLADLPSSQETETMFINKLVELATVPSNDYAEDSKK